MVCGAAGGLLKGASEGLREQNEVVNPEGLTMSSPSVPAFATDSDIKGIGGWLILHAIGLAIAPVVSALAIFADMRILGGSTHQATFHARPGLAVLILFEASTNAVMLLALIGLNVLFYQTRRSFPRWMIVFLVGAFVVTLCDHLGARHFRPTTTWTAVFQRFVAAAIWIPYFLLSHRVEQTFVD